MCKLIQRLDAWKDDHSLPVVLARAQVAALQTANDPEARYAAKRDLVHSLHTAGYSTEEFREALRLIDWMMKLNERLNDRFNEELKKYEEELEMPFVPSYERKALAQGRKEGFLDAVLRILKKKIGTVSASDQEQLKQLSQRQLNDPSIAALDFTSRAEFEEWLGDAD